MIEQVYQIGYYPILFFTLLTLVVLLINLIFNQTLKQTANNQDTPLVSILIPMRNEENNIVHLLNSIINQDYNNYEVFILDDHSNDNSYQVARSYLNKISNLQIIKGKELPNDWLGKNWACHQLSNYANGDLLLFVDADVCLNTKALNTLISYCYKYNLDTLSVFPTQIMNTFGEKLVVPLMNWVLLSFLPLILVRKSKFRSLVAANGQLLLFKKEVYQKIGGHLKVKNHPVEDMQLARNIKNYGYKIGTYLGGNLVKCNMYDGFKSSVNGFSKNFYKGFHTNWLIFILFVIIISISNITPFIFIFFNILYIIPILLIIVNRVILSYLSKQEVFTNILLHIPQFIVFLLVGILSVYKTKFGKNIWKGRQI